MFDYGKPVSGKNFFDRSGPKKDILRFIEEGVDFMIKAPRRYGQDLFSKRCAWRYKAHLS